LGTVDDGAHVAVEMCMGVVPGEHVLIVTDTFTLTVGEALRKAAGKVSPQNVRLVLVEDSR
jgi:leucyl aminopeptidase (aminopeptidase T)